jgi:phosphomevalonate kinase
MAIQLEHPGKLMLSGEWAVLEVGIPCVVMAIDKNVRVHATLEKTISITAPDLQLSTKEADWNGNELVWKTTLTPDEKEKLLISEHAIRTTLKYLQAKSKKVQPFSIRTASEETVVKLADGKNAKIGFGSSAAACVAIVRAILKLHGIKTENQKGLELVFKLACMAHFEAQGKVGSSFDVAASTFGGMLLYKRFDPQWLQQQATAGKNTAEIVEAEWPALQIEPLTIPKGFQLLIGYTGPDTSTKEMIKKVQACKAEKKEEYWRVMNSIQQCVQELIPAIKQNNSQKILEELQRNRNALVGLAEVSEIELETSALAKLANICEENGAAGKFSGSGGGGLGIGICFDSKTRQKIEEEWKKAGIVPVKAGIAPGQAKK